MPKYHQGYFKPRHPEKYVIHPRNAHLHEKGKGIIYRSGWEFTLMNFFDKSENVLRWSSEEVSICYEDPASKRIRRYFPDFAIQVKQKDGSKKIMVIEIKPLEQTVPPKRGKNEKRFIQESYEYARNLAKWKAADKWCHERGYEFKIMTEAHIFGQQQQKEPDAT